MEMNKQEWAKLLELPEKERDYHRDEEVVAASKVAVPTLRALQSSGAISSIKAPSIKGGYLRAWHLNESSKASVAFFINKSFNIEYRSAADIIKSIPGWDSILRFSRRLSMDTEGIIKAHPEDLFLDLVVGRFVLLRTHNIFLQREMFGIEKERQPIGMLSPAENASAMKFSPLSALTDNELSHVYVYAEYMHKNYPTMSSINVNIAADCAFLRLRGCNPTYYYE